MNIGVTTIITNEYNEILLIQRNDTHSWALPGGSLDLGESPDQGIVREVEEETGLKVMPVRLAFLNYLQIPSRPHLHFVFRCLKSGGELRPSEESLQVNYFKRRVQPKPILSLHRDVIENGWGHAGPPIWQKQRVPWELLPRWLWLKFVVYPRFERERQRKGEPSYVPPPRWQISGRVIIPQTLDTTNAVTGEIGHVWLSRDGKCELPGGILPDNRPPWASLTNLVKDQIGRPVTLKRLVGAYVDQSNPHMILVWEAEPLEPDFQTDAGVEIIPRGKEEAALPAHLQFVEAKDELADEEVEYQVLKL